MRMHAIFAGTTALLLGSLSTACAQGPLPQPAPYPAEAAAGQPVVPVAPYPALARPGVPAGPFAGAPPVPGAPAVPVSAGPPVPQPPGPQATTSAIGHVQVYLLDGEVDGLLLADGTVVKFPPHLTSVLTAAVRPGATVSVVGFVGAPTPYGHAVHALSITNTTTGQTVVDQPPATPPIPPFMRGLTRTSLTVSGTVARFLMNPPGDVDGLVLTSGEEVRFRPHLGRTGLSGAGGGVGAAERPPRSRISTGRPADERVVAGPDLILFRAVPLSRGDAPAGAVWVMQRLAGIRTPRWQLYQTGLIAVLVIACGVAATAWWFTHRLERGVMAIESRVERWRAHGSVRWQIHGFRRRPQSGSHGDVSSAPLKTVRRVFPNTARRPAFRTAPAHARQRLSRSRHSLRPRVVCLGPSRRP